MSELPNKPELKPDVFNQAEKRDRVWLHVLLFVLTLVSTTLSYALWVGSGAAGWSDLLKMPFLSQAIWFSVPLLLFLTVHEFGHYFAARLHHVSTTLPYYIPLPFLGIGTLGAVIRIREPIPSLTKLFDIGAAGPIAGFVAVFIMLIVSLATLPDVNYVESFEGHDALKEYVAQNGEFPRELIREEGAGPGQVFYVGETVLYVAVAHFFDNVPPMYEMYHYPFLFASWLGLFFTALNLLPVGQLDGGHVLFALVGPRWHLRIARSFMFLLLLSGAIGYGMMATDDGWMGAFKWPILAAILYLILNRAFGRDQSIVAPSLVALLAASFAVNTWLPGVAVYGHGAWLMWGFILSFLLGVEHPPVLYSEPLTPGRRALALLSFVIFILCFSIRPFYYV